MRLPCAADAAPYQISHPRRSLTTSSTPSPHNPHQLGENLTEDELQAMIDEFDTDQDGQISMDEFTAIMKSTSLYE